MTQMRPVLIVEDELQLLTLLTEALEEEGYEVHGAANALVAFEMLHKHPEIGLVVTDIGLPGTGDGRDLAGYVKATRPDLPILFVTGQGGAATDADSASVLQKPFALDRFVEAVRSRLPAVQEASDEALLAEEAPGA
jgi:DNA-binding NtrC family response regulator